MTVLSVIQDVADEIGIPRPSAGFSSTDAQVRQLLAILRREGQVLSRRHHWQALMREVVHTTVATESQGELTTICPGIRYLPASPHWNRTQMEPLGGPLSGSEWQSLKAFTATGPYNDFRIRGGDFLMIPVPPAGESIALEYLSNYWSQTSSAADQSTIAADDDVMVLDEEVMSAGVRWRFLEAKGLEYAEAFREYETMVVNAIAHDGGRRSYQLDGGRDNVAGNVRAPLGSWNL